MWLTCWLRHNSIISITSELKATAMAIHSMCGLFNPYKLAFDRDSIVDGQERLQKWIDRDLFSYEGMAAHSNVFEALE